LFIATIAITIITHCAVKNVATICLLLQDIIHFLQWLSLLAAGVAAMAGAEPTR